MSSPARRRTATVGLLAALLVPLLTPSTPADAAASQRKPRCHGETATIVGTNRADRITGTKGRDVIVTKGGRDVVKGLGGDDVVCTGGGNDKVLAGGGDDYVDAGGGRDVVDGQDGADVIWTGGGKRELAVGGTGDDHLVLEGNGSHALAGVGADYVDVHGRGGNVDGGPGDDVLRGGPGDDTIEGGDGADICNGNGGRDVCAGGAPGGDANTPGDPDRCDAELMRSCRSADSTAYSGTAHGTLADGLGVVETWSATFTMDSADDTPQLLEGPATFQWSIGGTDREDCTYAGSATLTGRASFMVWLDFGYYTGQLHPARAEPVKVQVTCPLGGTTTTEIWPLDGDAANTGNVPLHPDMSWIRGDRSYHPGGAAEVDATWSWDAR